MFLALDICFRRSAELNGLVAAALGFHSPDLTLGWVSGSAPPSLYFAIGSPSSADELRLRDSAGASWSLIRYFCITRCEVVVSNLEGEG